MTDRSADAYSELAAEKMKSATELADKVLAGHVFDAAHEVYTACTTLAIGLKIALRPTPPTTKPEDRYSDPLFVAVNAVHEKDERQRMHDQGVRDGLHPPVPPKHKPVA